MLQAIDPDIGIGYGPLLNIALKTDLLRDVNFKKQKATKVPLEWSGAHQLLLKKWHENNLQTDPIQLTAPDLQTLTPGETSIFPPSLSVLFRITNDGLFLETAGRATATALIGRFTSWSEQIHEISRDISALESAANPDVIFADIGQLSDPHSDNINRRKHIYTHEIPVNVHSTLAAESQIALTDLMVSVNDGNLILESKRHQKTLIPRLTTAYNYNRNSLALFRILCDLQFQGIQGSYDFSLEQYFPGLSIYPRVVYQQTILCPATWYLSAQQITTIIQSPSADRIT